MGMIAAVALDELSGCGEVLGVDVAQGYDIDAFDDEVAV
jgi:hypothetical protein